MSDGYGENGDMNDKREKRDKLINLNDKRQRDKLIDLISGYMICQFVGNMDDVARSNFSADESKALVAEAIAEADELLRRLDSDLPAQRSHKLN